MGLYLKASTMKTIHKQYGIALLFVLMLLSVTPVRMVSNAQEETPTDIPPTATLEPTAIPPSETPLPTDTLPPSATAMLVPTQTATATLELLPTEPLIEVIPEVTVEATVIEFSPVVEVTADPILSETPLTPEVTQSPDITVTVPVEITEELAPTIAVTASATTTHEPLPEEPSLAIAFQDDFESGDVSAWQFGSGWGVLPIEDGNALRVYNRTDDVTLLNSDYYEAAIEADFYVEYGTASLSLRRSTAGDYTVALTSTGQVTLSKTGSELASETIANFDATQWHTLRLSAFENVLRVSLDDSEIILLSDPTGLPPGEVAFGSAFEPLADDATPIPPVNTLLVDNVIVWVEDDNLPENTPTATLTASPTALPTATLTPSPTLMLETATPTPTATVTNIPPTAEPTLVAAQPEAPMELVYEEGFESESFDNWVVRDGWALVPHHSGLAMQSSDVQRLTYTQSELTNIGVSVMVQQDSGKMRLDVHETRLGSYNVIYDANGTLELYRRDQLLGTATVPAIEPGRWRTLFLTVIDGELTLYLNNNELLTVTDPEPLPAGDVSIAWLEGDALTVDDFEIWQSTFVQTITEPIMTPTFGPSPTVMPNFAAISAMSVQSVLAQSTLPESTSNDVSDYPGLVTALSQSRLQNGVCTQHTVITLLANINVPNPPVGSGYFTQFLGRSGLPIIQCPVTINGNGFTLTRTGDQHYRLLTVQGALPGGFIDVNKGNLTLNEVNITNGYASGVGGGAILVADGILEISGGKIYSNVAQEREFFWQSIPGGGIYVYQGRLSVTGAEITDNVAGAPVTFNPDNTVSGGGDGGGIGLVGTATNTTVTIVNSLISNNRATRFGGAVFSNTFNNQANNNCIINNRQEGSAAVDYRDFYSSTYLIDATDNWWGDPLGPSGDGPGSAPAADSVSTNVDYANPKPSQPTNCTSSNLTLADFGIVTVDNGRAWTDGEKTNLLSGVERISEAFRITGIQGANSVEIFRNGMFLDTGETIQFSRIPSTGNSLDDYCEVTSVGQFVVTCRGDLFNPDNSGDMIEQTAIHEFGHIFDLNSAGEGNRLRDLIPLPPPDGDIEDCSRATVFGLFNNAFARGSRGWGTASGGISLFQINPLNTPEEAVADMFLNWVYRRTTDKENTYFDPVNDDPCMENSKNDNRTWQDVDTSWEGFRNIDGTGQFDLRCLGADTCEEVDKIPALPGNVRYQWMDQQMREYLGIGGQN